MTIRHAPLHGIKVLDLTRVLAGPWCTQNLADLGAEVIKIERPGAGDDTRGWGPPYLHDEHGDDTSEAAYYLSANRNKKSVTLDFTTNEGKAVLLKLVSWADIVVENYKVGGLKKYGLDYDSLQALNPQLIYCSITGFGQNGPYANRAGYDYIIQGMGGLMSITGERDDHPGGGPQKAGVAVADLFTGMYASVAILAALQERHVSGLGQYIDMALLDCQVAMLANHNLNYLCTDKAPKRVGNAHLNLVPYQVFEVADGHLILAVGNDSQFKTLCDLIQRPDLAADERFSKNKGRVINQKALIPVLQDIMKMRKRDDWLADFERINVPAGPINNVDQVYADPQVVAREMKITMPHSIAGHVDLAASPMRFSHTPVEYKIAPPTLGQHNDEILRGLLQLSDEEIKNLGL